MTDSVQCPSCGEENPARFRLCGFCGTPLVVAASREERKTVTIVFTDLVGSTALAEAVDSEALREVMARYYEAMTRVLQRHGGTIAKFIGDAVMAVFGLPKLHEDDALRAVRAASEMQVALERLNADLQARYGIALAVRTGVNTGEVVVGDAKAQEGLVIGDAVNVAARLEQMAGRMEILIGDTTHRLVRDAVDAERVDVELKGKSQPLTAHRLIRVHGEEGVARRQDAPMVGRESELALLTAAYRDAVDHGGARAVTILGEAGAGKSRLIHEFVSGLDGEAHVLRGRCLHYGEGITFWPIVEVVRGATGIMPETTGDQALVLLRESIDDPMIVDRLAATIGLVDATFPIGELFWATRAFLEGLATERPVIVVIDDIHWAEETFIELLEHLTDSTEVGPIVLLATSRHDLLEERPAWGTGPRRERIVLEPLSVLESEQVVNNLLDAALEPAVRSRIVKAADGNPLYVEQLLSSLIDDGLLELQGDRWVPTRDLGDLRAPPSIHALLAARLDRLDRDERAVVEPASVVGFEFAQSAVQALVADSVDDRVWFLCMLLARKQLIQSTPASTIAGEEGYRFRHMLIHDAVYGGILKRQRAELHERFVAWADGVDAYRGRATEYEEILGWHLEQAYRYLSELGPINEHGEQLGRRAAERLASAGRRAFIRGDMAAAASLFGRAVATLPEGDAVARALLPDLAEAQLDLGDFGAARRSVEWARTSAHAAGDTPLAAKAGLIRLLVDRQSEAEAGWDARVLAEVERALPIFEAHGDHAGSATAQRLLFYIHGSACRYAEAAEAAGEIIEHARVVADVRLQRRGMVGYAQAAMYGPTPVGEAIASCQAFLADAEGDRRTEALIRLSLAQLEAMRGDFDLAREHYRLAQRMLAELGPGVLTASTATDSAVVELLAGDLDAAETELRRDMASLTEMGERFLLATVMGLLARVRYRAGDLDDADRFSRQAQEMAADDDLMEQARWRGIRARVLVQRGDLDEAVRLAREAAAIHADTSAPILRAEVEEDLAEVLAIRGELAEATALRDRAAGCYVAKGARAPIAVRPA